MKEQTKNIIDCEELMRASFENATLGVCITSPDGIILKPNNALCNMLGYKESELINKHINDFTFKDDKKSAANIFNELINGLISTANFEKRCIHKKGHLIWVSISSSFIKKQNYKESCLVTHVQEITERKLEHEALRESEDKYRAISEYSHNAICIVNEEAKITWVNSQLLNLANGYTREQILGADSFVAFIAPESLEFVVSNFYKVLAGEPYEHYYMFYFINAKGEKRLCEKYMIDVKDKQGKLNLIISMLDITERKQAEEAIRESEERFKTFFNTNLDSIVINRADNSKIVSINKGFTKFTGYQECEVIGKTTSELNIWKEPKERNKFYNTIKLNNSIYNFETWFISKNGNHRLGLLSATIIEIKGEKHILSTCRDITEHKQAEEAIRESEERFKTAFNASADSIAISRLSDGKAIAVNKAFTKIMGYEESDVLGKTSLEMNVWNNPEDQKKLYNTVKKKNKLENYEAGFITKSGNHRIGLISSTIIEIKGEKHILVTCRDITEQKEAEERIKILSKFPDENPNPVMRFDYKGNLLFANKPSIALLNKYVTQNKASGELLILLTQVAKHKKAIKVEINTYTLIYSITITPITENNYINIYANDITERKKAEEELKKSEAKYKLLVEHIHDAIIVDDIDGKVTFANQQFLDIFGIKKKIVDEISFDDYIAPDWIQTLRDRHNKRMQGKAVPTHFEYEGINSNGNRIWLEVDVEPIKDDDGNIIGTQSAIRNITKRKQAEAEIIKLNADLENRVAMRTEQLERANQELESFSYSVSHDLRSPLRAIDGFSKIILDEYGKMFDKEEHRLFGVIRKNITQMNQLIDDLLNLSRTGKAQISYSKVDMDKLVKSVYKEITTKEQKANIKINIEELPDSVCDKPLIYQVWFNLLSNAIKFSKHAEPAQITICGKTENGINTYYIKDNGVGYNPDYSHKLFGVFQRLHKTGEFEGTGIGLAIVMRIIHRHDGKVWSESKLNEGATFYFSIPEHL